MYLIKGNLYQYSALTVIHFMFIYFPLFFIQALTFNCLLLLFHIYVAVLSTDQTRFCSFLIKQPMLAFTFFCLQKEMATWGNAIYVFSFYLTREFAYAACFFPYIFVGRRNAFGESTFSCPKQKRFSIFSFGLAKKKASNAINCFFY